VIILSRKKSFFFSLKTQFDNVGDALINRELISSVSDYGAVYVDISRSPQEFVDTVGVLSGYNINIINGRFGTLRLYLKIFCEKMFGNDVFYFLNPGGLGGVKSLRKNLISLFYNLLLMSVRLIGGKVCLIGVSYKQMSMLDLFFLKIRALLLSWHYVRDSNSYSYLQRNKIKVSGILPDLSFFLYKKKLDQFPAKNPDVLSLSFRFDADEGVSYDLLRDCLAAYLINCSFSEIRFVSQVKRDSVLMSALCDELSGILSVKCSFFDVSSSINDCFRVYSGCDLLLSNRLHALLMAGYVGVKPIAVVSVGKNSKISAMFADLNMSKFVIDLERLAEFEPPCGDYMAHLYAQYALLDKEFRVVLNC